MADNFVANSGSGGSTFASDDVGGIQYPRVKHSYGRDAQASDVGTAFRTLSVSGTNITTLKGSAGVLYSLIVTNTNAAVRYLKFYNKASAPVLASDTPVMTIAIPGSATGAGFAINFGPGADFSAGIGYALTTGSADTDANAVAAGEICVNGVYI